MLVAPAATHDGNHHLPLLDVRGSTPLVASKRIRSMEDEFRNAMRVPRRVGNCDRGALRGAQQGETLEPKRIDDGFEIILKAREGDFGHVSVGQADTPPVIANKTRAARK